MRNSFLSAASLIPRLHDTTGCTTGCQTGCTTGLTTVLNRLNEQPLFVQTVIKPCCGSAWGPQTTANGWLKLSSYWDTARDIEIFLPHDAVCAAQHKLESCWIVKVLLYLDFGRSAYVVLILHWFAVICSIWQLFVVIFILVYGRLRSFLYLFAVVCGRLWSSGRPRVVKPVWQPVVSCIQTFNRLSVRFHNQFDNRLYRVDGALAFVIPVVDTLCNLLCYINNNRSRQLIRAKIS